MRGEDDVREEAIGRMEEEQKEVRTRVRERKKEKRREEEENGGTEKRRRRSIEA